MSVATVRCEGPCGRVVWKGGEITSQGEVKLPFSDGQEVLTEFAERECPAGGYAGGCPHVRRSLQERADQRPERLRELVTGLQARITALEQRTPHLVHATWPVPALTAGTRDVTLDWGVALGRVSPTAVVVHELPTGNDSAVSATVRAVRAAGVDLTVTATRQVTAGGRIRVLAAGWAAG